MGTALLFALAAEGFAADQPLPFAAPFVAGQLGEPKNREASGLAASRRTEGLLWTHSDSGGAPVLYALNADGSERGAVRIKDVKNEDWEDMAAFEQNGRALLLVADVGDNFSTRSPVALHVVAEPPADQLSPGSELAVSVAYSTYFVYEDGARDCEAVAVDGAEGAVYLLSKRDVPARLYRVLLQPADKKTPATARLVGTVSHIPQPVGIQRLVPSPLFGLRGNPTALDFSPDARRALVLVYGGPLLFERALGETWAQALARAPIALPAFDLPQAEAAAFSRDGKNIYVCSEKVPTLLRYEPPLEERAAR